MKLRLLMILSILSISTVLAAVPQTINYQGRLTNDSGENVADGMYNMLFTIYDDATAGQVLWSETHPNVE